MQVIDLVLCGEAGGGWENTSNVYCIRFVTWNIGTMTGKSVEVAETLHRRKIDVCCVQETRWTLSGARAMGEGMSRYNFLWQSYKDNDARVGFLISGRWIVTGLSIWREWMNALCVWKSWSTNHWWPASVHMHLKWVEVWRTKTVSEMRCSVWQEAYQRQSWLLLEGTWVVMLVPMSMGMTEFTVDVALGRERWMVNDY